LQKLFSRVYKNTFFRVKDSCSFLKILPGFDDNPCSRAGRRLLRVFPDFSVSRLLLKRLGKKEWYQENSGLTPWEMRFHAGHWEKLFELYAQ